MEHRKQIEFCEKVKRKFPDYFNGVYALDAGSLDINGNNQYLFTNSHYIGVDIDEGNNVDFVSKIHELNLPNNSFDVIVSTEVFQHDMYYAESINNIYRLLKPGGLFLFTCAATGRAEHGTKKNSPKDAPLLAKFGDWSDYYRNLTENDIKDIIDVDGLFSSHKFEIDTDHKDLFFWGKKTGVWKKRQNRSYHNDKSIATLDKDTASVRLEPKVTNIVEAKRQADAEIKKLNAEINRTHGSLSWRITKPLRFLSQRFPVVGATVLKILSAPFRLISLIKSVSAAEAPRLVFTWVTPTDISSQITAYGKFPKHGTRKIVYYTAIFSDHDTLMLPDRINEDVDYVCFTDRSRNTYGIWQLRISPYHHPDPTRVARYIKTHPHELFPNYDFAIWVDGNVNLRSNIKDFINILQVEETSIGLIPHPIRDCVYQEFDACRQHRKDKREVIDTQEKHYRDNGIKEHSDLYETNFMVIDLADEKLSSIFRIWWQQIEKFSRRDQLGLVWAMNQVDITVSHMLPKGVSVREDEEFTYFTHQQSRQLSVPEELLDFGRTESPFTDVFFAEVKNARLSKLKKIKIDIVVCVHNALEDVQLCLESVRQHLVSGQKIIIVNDYSDQATTDYLRSFSDNNKQVLLIENNENLGYTKSANIGMSSGTADFCILLNSDTIVSKDWALKMFDATMHMPDVGIVGPLSNAAGVQSLPNIRSNGNNTAINIIPNGISNEDIDNFLEKISLANTIPQVPLVHGFCFGIKRDVIEKIGFFDSSNFARYYGEENDYCFRAAAAGFRFTIATNTFVFHRKSRSIDEEERIIHMKEAGLKLRELYGVDRVRTACLQGEQHPILMQIRKQAEEYLSA